MPNTIQDILRAESNGLPEETAACAVFNLTLPFKDALALPKEIGGWLERHRRLLLGQTPYAPHALDRLIAKHKAAGSPEIGLKPWLT